MVFAKTVLPSPNNSNNNNNNISIDRATLPAYGLLKNIQGQYKEKVFQKYVEYLQNINEPHLDTTQSLVRRVKLLKEALPILKQLIQHKRFHEYLSPIIASMPHDDKVSFLLECADELSFGKALSFCQYIRKFALQDEEVLFSLALKLAPKCNIEEQIDQFGIDDEEKLYSIAKEALKFRFASLDLTKFKITHEMEKFQILNDAIEQKELSFYRVFTNLELFNFHHKRLFALIQTGAKNGYYVIDTLRFLPKDVYSKKTDAVYSVVRDQFANYPLSLQRMHFLLDLPDTSIDKKCLSDSSLYSEEEFMLWKLPFGKNIYNYELDKENAIQEIKELLFTAVQAGGSLLKDTQRNVLDLLSSQQLMKVISLNINNRKEKESTGPWEYFRIIPELNFEEKNIFDLYSKLLRKQNKSEFTLPQYNDIHYLSSLFKEEKHLKPMMIEAAGHPFFDVSSYLNIYEFSEEEQKKNSYKRSKYKLFFFPAKC